MALQSLFSRDRWRAHGLAGVALLGLCSSLCLAVPVIPGSDSTVVETLPKAWGDRAAMRRQQQALARQPQDEALALDLASHYLDQARTQGDARYAGLALGALSAWVDDTKGKGAAPVDVLVMRATVLQYLHEFDAAAALLVRATRLQPLHPQAWLTLATIRRVQGRYADSNAACDQLVKSGQPLHAAACLAENQSLMGSHGQARERLTQLLNAPMVMAPGGEPLRQWLLTTLAELHERAGQVPEAERAWQGALALGHSPYVLTAYADFLLQHQREREVVALLKGLDPTDAVMLRLAIAGHRLALPQAAAWRHEVSARLKAAASRPGAERFHAREQARFALEVQGHAKQALVLAWRNLAHQREGADWLLMAQAAMAQPEPAIRQQALAELQALQQRTGFQDARLAKL